MLVHRRATLVAFTIALTSAKQALAATALGDAEQVKTTCCSPKQAPTILSKALGSAADSQPLKFDEELYKGLGDIDFKPLTIPDNNGAAADSGAEASDETKVDLARKHFLLGLKCLHVFWFDLATEQFQYARRLVPGFAMAYWGEAMSYKQPLWQVENLKAANEVFENMDKSCDLSALTKRETDYIAAARAYFKDGASLEERERGYSKAMYAMQNAEPDDADAAAFYGLSLLGMATSAQRYLSSDEVKATLERARTQLAEVGRKWPRHAGGLHYLVHAYDVPDPKVAARGRDPGVQLAELAYRSCHAVHMVTHIALVFGEWRLLTDANEQAVDASDKYCTQRGYGDECDADNRYHALEWQHYGLLMQGRVKEATKLLHRAQDVADDMQKDIYFTNWAARMYANHIFNTEDWEQRPSRNDPPPPAMLAAEDKDLRQLPRQLVSETVSLNAFWLSYSEGVALLAKAYQVVRRNVDRPDASRDVEACLSDVSARLKTIKGLVKANKTSSYLERVMDTLVLQVDALRQVYRCKSGTDTSACAKWRPALEAALRSQQDNPKGADAPSITNSDVREFYGVLLNYMGEDAEYAAELFQEVLSDLPNRIASIEGLERAKARLPIAKAMALSFA